MHIFMEWVQWLQYDMIWHKTRRHTWYSSVCVKIVEWKYIPLPQCNFDHQFAYIWRSSRCIHIRLLNRYANELYNMEISWNQQLPHFWLISLFHYYFFSSYSSFLAHSKCDLFCGILTWWYIEYKCCGLTHLIERLSQARSIQLDGLAVIYSRSVVVLMLFDVSGKSVIGTRSYRLCA